MKSELITISAFFLLLIFLFFVFKYQTVVSIDRQNLEGSSRENILSKRNRLEKSISPKDYQQMLGKGIDVTWVETKLGMETYNKQMVRDFKQAGFSHIRLRIKFEPDTNLLEHLDKVVFDILEEGMIPVIAYHGGDFEEKPTLENLNKSVAWWKIVSEHTKNYPPLVSYDLIVEVSDALNKENDMLNLFYDKAVAEIRKENPTRIIFISPLVRSSPENLVHLKIPTQHNNYLMAEWHFYASGPDKENILKKWTTGTEAEKDLIRNKIKLALDWQKQTGIYTWVGAWMAGNYNKGDNYSVSEQIKFANFMTCELTKNSIPFAINSDNKYYDPINNKWIQTLKPVLDEILKTECR
jgi:hypothetical protein